MPKKEWETRPGSIPAEQSQVVVDGGFRFEARPLDENAFGQAEAFGGGIAGGGAGQAAQTPAKTAPATRPKPQEESEALRTEENGRPAEPGPAPEPPALPSPVEPAEQAAPEEAEAGKLAKDVLPEKPTQTARDREEGKKKSGKTREKHSEKPSGRPAPRYRALFVLRVIPLQNVPANASIDRTCPAMVAAN